MRALSPIGDKLKFDDLAFVELYTCLLLRILLLQLKMRHQNSKPRLASSPAAVGMRLVSNGMCRGWSTTLLNSEGSLFTYGTLDGAFYVARGQRGRVDSSQPLPLKFQSKTPSISSDDPQNAHYAIKQFSSGRGHVLGLSDSGRIWSWTNPQHPAVHIKFLHLDLNEDNLDLPTQDSPSALGRVVKVVAGWDKSSAWLRGTGIVIWQPVTRPASRTRDAEGVAGNEDDADMVLVTATALVPGTAYCGASGSGPETSEEARALSQRVGEVINYVVLDGFVVYVTDLAKVFAGKITYYAGSLSVPDIMELTDMQGDPDADGAPSATEVQGSFRSFAVFLRHGGVVIAHTGYLQALWAREKMSSPVDLPNYRRIPALQNSGVISIAFGDWHFLALHSNGHITSYDSEPSGCGALGLGGDPKTTCGPIATLRGFDRRSAARTGRKLLPQCYVRGRRVWFEQMKRKWMAHWASGGRDPAESRERLRLVNRDPVAQAEVSEWIEQQAMDWDKRPGVPEADEDGLGAYFVLGVAAAGWHSGALVLVNDEVVARLNESCVTASGTAGVARSQAMGILTSIAQGSSNWARFLGMPPTESAEDAPVAAGSRNIRRPPQDLTQPLGPGLRYIWANDDFPRLRLSNGVEMPGEIPFSEWRFGRPDLTVDDAPWVVQ